MGDKYKGVVSEGLIVIGVAFMVVKTKSGAIRCMTNKLSNLDFG